MEYAETLYGWPFKILTMILSLNDVTKMQDIERTICNTYFL